MYKFVQEYDTNICDEMQNRMDELVELDEKMREAHKNNEKMHRSKLNIFMTKGSFRVNLR